MLHTKFQTFKPSGSEDEDFFLCFFYVFEHYKQRAHLDMAI